jgi:hypothetical protein
MKIAINLALFAASAVLIYFLIESIRVPINFKSTREAREVLVRDRLKEIAELQKMYKGLRDDYAGDFDSLAYVLMNDSFTVERVIGDPNDTTIKVTRTMVRFPAKDSLLGFLKKGSTVSNTTDLAVYFAEIRLVPYSDVPPTGKGAKAFEIIADSIGIASGTGGEVKTPTFEVRTPLSTYLPEYDATYTMYDKRYDPTTYRKVGDLSKPSTSGNW